MTDPTTIARSLSEAQAMAKAEALIAYTKAQIEFTVGCYRDTASNCKERLELAERNLRTAILAGQEGGA